MSMFERVNQINNAEIKNTLYKKLTRKLIPNILLESQSNEDFYKNTLNNLLQTIEKLKNEIQMKDSIYLITFLLKFFCSKDSLKLLDG